MPQGSRTPSLSDYPRIAIVVPSEACLALDSLQAVELVTADGPSSKPCCG